MALFVPVSVMNLGTPERQQHKATQGILEICTPLRCLRPSRLCSLQVERGNLSHHPGQVLRVADHAHFSSDAHNIRMILGTAVRQTLKVNRERDCIL